MILPEKDDDENEIEIKPGSNLTKRQPGYDRRHAHLILYAPV